jgi:hypothetical protein
MILTLGNILEGVLIIRRRWLPMASNSHPQFHCNNLLSKFIRVLHCIASFGFEFLSPGEVMGIECGVGGGLLDICDKCVECRGSGGPVTCQQDV